MKTGWKMACLDLRERERESTFSLSLEFIQLNQITLCQHNYLLKVFKNTHSFKKILENNVKLKATIFI